MNFTLITRSSSFSVGFVRVKQAFNEKFDDVETVIAEHIQRRLESTESTNAMFRLIKRYKPLLPYRRVADVLSSTQRRVLDSVRNDLMLLARRCNDVEADRKFALLIKSRGYSPELGIIILNLQLDRRTQHMKKLIEDAFPEELRSADCQHLLSYMSEVLGRLKSNPITTKWKNHWIGDALRQSNKGLLTFVRQERRDVVGSGRGGSEDWVDVPPSQTEAGRPLNRDQRIDMRVNFDERFARLYEESMTLQSLGLGDAVEVHIKGHLAVAKNNTHIAIVLLSSLKTYAQATKRLQENDSWWKLVAHALRPVHILLDECHRTDWASTEQSVQIVTEKVNRLQKNCVTVSTLLDTLEQRQEELHRLTTALDTCGYTSDAFAGVLEALRSRLQELEIDGFKNVGDYASYLDNKVRSVLSQRLADALKAWIVAFHESWRKTGKSGTEITEWMASVRSFIQDEEEIGMGGGRRDVNMASAPPSRADRDAEGGRPSLRLSLPTANHKMVMQNDSVFVQPDLETVSHFW